jgi:hypothetical protein
VSKRKEPSDFYAFIPQQIEADWDQKYGPHLAGFPINILFARVTNDPQTRRQPPAEVCYWFDPSTFRQGGVILRL